jgi:cytochrome d ubiquinol oxidase subunit I
VGVIAALLQPISGDSSARLITNTQPAKLAAMESLFQTRSGAPLLVGGIPDPDSQTVSFALEIPRGLSLLAHHDPDATVQGLDRVPRDQWPPVPLIHYSFQIMVGSALAILAFALFYWITRWRKREPGRWLLRALVLSGALSVAALEAGWIVTEVGRQPWIIYNLMLTARAVTPAPGIWITFTGFVVLYLLLAVTLVWLLRRLATGRPDPEGTADADQDTLQEEAASAAT